MSQWYEIACALCGRSLQVHRDWEHPPKICASCLKARRFSSCFILAPFGAETSFIRTALDDRGIRWHDQAELRAGVSWVDSVEKAMTRSDFVCVVLPTASHRENVLFELGIAYAKRKPILAFLGPSTSLPSDVVGLVYVRADSMNQEAVRSALDTFLAHASHTPPLKPLPTAAKRKAKAKSYHMPTASASAVELERRTTELFRDAGFILAEPSEPGDEGADFAVWIDEVQHSLGNPVLVQVKVGDLSGVRLDQATSQLRDYVAKTHGRSGLLVYWDRKSREFPAVSLDWPLIFRLSGRALARLASQGLLAQELVRLRNAAVHGKV